MTENNQKEEWSVQVYRYTDKSGWQKAKIHTKNKSTKKRKKSSNFPAVWFGASPRLNCVVLPALHQKFSLVNPSSARRQDGNNNGSGCTRKNDDAIVATTNAATMEENRNCMIRRGDRLLMLSNTGIRAMTLKFRSTVDCMAFSDRFAELNPLARPIPARRQPIEAPNNMPPPPPRNPKYPTVAANNSSRGRGAVPGADKEQATQNQHPAQKVSDAAPAAADDPIAMMTRKEKDLTASYVANLLHDDSFLGFVFKLESFLESSADGAKLLEGLEE